VEVWDRARLADIVRVVGAALPEEGIGADDLESLCFDDPDPTVVLGTPDADGVAIAVRRIVGDRVTASVHLVAVVPTARRAGRGRRLLDGAVAISPQGQEFKGIGVIRTFISPVIPKPAPRTTRTHKRQSGSRI